jgi:cap3/cap4 methyltransferase
VAPALGAVFGLAVADADTGADVARPWRELAVGDLDAARTSTAIPTMAEPELALPVGLDLLRRAASERSPLLFVSDVRSGTAEMPNFSAHVVENMTAQATWARIIDPSCALLKYRLPYTSDPAKLVSYPRGDVLLPVWGPLTTTECRLASRHAFGWAPQDAAEHERRMFYVNAVLRERVHFDHTLSPHPDLDNRFDSAAEVFIWEAFRAAGGAGKGTAADLVAATTKALGESFEDIRRKRDHLLTTAAPVQGGTLKRYRPEEQDGVSTSTVSLAALLAERGRPVWWANWKGSTQ